MVLGQYDAKIDQKGRIAFPKKLRKDLGSDLIVTLGYERSLIVVTQKQWKTLLRGIEERSFLQQEIRDTQRYLLGGASFVTIDKKGRLLLPDYLREFATVEKEVVFLGMNRYVELWSRQRWYQYRGILEKTIHVISNRLVTQEGEKKR